MFTVLNEFNQKEQNFLVRHPSDEGLASSPPKIYVTLCDGNNSFDSSIDGDMVYDDDDEHDDNIVEQDMSMVYSNVLDKLVLETKKTKFL